MEMVKKFFKDESGASLVEYGLLVALIAIATIVAINALQGGVNTTFNNAADQMNG
jgi:pilus assembly protein Flp/PilA